MENVTIKSNNVANVKFINLTPHVINLNDGRAFPSEGVARVTTTYTKPNAKGICRQEYGEVAGLPKPQKGVKYIVSAIVLAAAKAKGRRDCVAPATNHPNLVRDEQGHIVSVPCFVY